MFKKLVANLPFNPSLIAQVGFYADRLKQERSVRRLSFVLITLTMMVQMFAVMIPPERSLAASSNHIINGLRTRDDILRAWDSTGSDIPAIYGMFGVVRSDIASLTTRTNAVVTSNAGDYWSIGRNSIKGYNGVQEKYKNSQVAVQYAGDGTSTTVDDRYIYHRELRAWDRKNPYNKYPAFEGTISATGKKFWILIDCGNLTTLGKYTPPYIPPPTIEPTPTPIPTPIPVPTPTPTPTPTPVPTPVPTPTPEPEPIKPGLEIRKTIIDRPSHLEPGDTFSYRIEYRNPVTNSLAEDVVIEDDIREITKYFQMVSAKPTNTEYSNGLVRLEVGGLSSNPNYSVITINLRLKDQVPSGTNICNVARITASNTDQDVSDNVCIGVIVKCPFDSAVDNINNPNCVEPKLVCSAVDYAVNLATRKATFRTTVESSNPANTTIKRYLYEYGDGSSEEFTSSQLTHQTSHSFEPGSYVTKVTVFFMTTGQSESGDKSVSCEAPISFEADQPLGQSKSVKNITQQKDGDAAIESVVNAGDVLEYTLSTTNSQNYERTNVDVSDYIGDVLEYADLDIEFLKAQGGRFDKDTSKVIWEGLTIEAGSGVDSVFRVTIKDPIPATNKPSSVTTSYDCKISNQYGNEITMDINCPLVKGLETLPSTGPGSSMVMMTGMTVVIGYFFARSRLLAQEIDLVRRDYAATGGM